MSAANYFGGVRTRARNARRAQPVFSGPINSLSSPMWDTYFQALAERGVSRMADGSVGAAKGMFPKSRPSVAYSFGDLDADPSFTDPSAARQRYNRLRQATGTGDYYQSHDDWMRTRGF